MNAETSKARYILRNTGFGIEVIRSKMPVAKNEVEFTGNIRKHLQDSGIKLLRDGGSVTFTYEDQSYSQLLAAFYA